MSASPTMDLSNNTNTVNNNNNSKDVKLLVILGTTGVGKSKLALEICQRIRSKGVRGLPPNSSPSRDTADTNSNSNNNDDVFGEVINADAMQVFKGLEIATNKMTEEEIAEARVPHHLLGTMDFFDRQQRNFTVLQFKEVALAKIHEISQVKHKLPVLVGGTNYYIQAVVFEDSLIEGEAQLQQQLKQQQQQQQQQQLDPEQVQYLYQVIDDNNMPIYEKLKIVDPKMAERLHPNDERKIRRSLEVFKDTGGVRHSALIEQQRQRLRFNDSATAFIFLSCKKEVLSARLDQRVDDMMRRGLLQEIEQFHARLQEARSNDPEFEINYTKGILQSIGFKEFDKYLEFVRGKSEEEKRSEEALALLQECVDLLKRNTRRYANRQLQWLKYQLFDRIKDNNNNNNNGNGNGNDSTSSATSESGTDIRIYEFDTTDLDRWDSDIVPNAVTIAEALLNNEDVPAEITERFLMKPKQVGRGAGSEKMEWKKYVCDVCNGRVMNGLKEWQQHLQSRSHRTAKRKQNKNKKNKNQSAAAAAALIATANSENASSSDNHDHYDDDVVVVDNNASLLLSHGS